MLSRSDAYRKDNPDRKFLQSRAWREKFRPMQLSRQPLCEHCALLGKVEQATEVDHIKRPLGDEVLQRNPENWQSLCGFHHKRKSIWERGDRKRPLVIGVALDGWRVELPNGCVERDRSLRGGRFTIA